MEFNFKYVIIELQVLLVRFGSNIGINIGIINL